MDLGSAGLPPRTTEGVLVELRGRYHVRIHFLNSTYMDRMDLRFVTVSADHHFSLHPHCR